MISLLAPVWLGSMRPPVTLNASSGNREDRAAGPGPCAADIIIEHNTNLATVKWI